MHLSNVGSNRRTKLLTLTLVNLACVLCYGQQKTKDEIKLPKIAAFAFLPDIHIVDDSLSIDYTSGSIKTVGAENNSTLFETNEKYIQFITKRSLVYGIAEARYEIENEIKDFVTLTFLIDTQGVTTNLKLLKQAQYQLINKEVIWAFKSMPKIVAPTNKLNKKGWTLVTCRVYFDISPIKPLPKKPTNQIYKINKEELKMPATVDTNIACTPGKE